MGPSGEDRRRIYEEERVAEEGREEIQRESKQRKQKQVSVGSLAIIGVVLASACQPFSSGVVNPHPRPLQRPLQSWRVTFMMPPMRYPNESALERKRLCTPKAKILLCLSSSLSGNGLWKGAA